MNFLDLSGYMFSGKSAVSDLIREHSGYQVPNYRSEFDLIRIPHGLHDLKHALIDDWSWVRSDKAIREFINLTDTLNRSPTNLVEKLFKPGFSYSKKYKNFLPRTKRFVEDITDHTWPMPWPYELSSIGPIKHAKLKVISKLQGRHAWPEIKYHLASGNEFLKHAKNYLHDLLVDEADAGAYHTIVTHNMLEPYDPAAGFCFFESIKSIVVDRDVRDIYMTATNHSDGFNDVVPLYSRIIGAFDVDVFIARQKILRSKTKYLQNENIFRIKFEDFVNSYDDSCLRLRGFLNISEACHVDKFRYFNPDVSKKNIALWRRATRYQRSAIARIENELPELCHQ